MDLSLPKYVRFDFLLVLISAGLMTLSFYYLYVEQIDEIQNFMKFLFVIGCPLFIYSLSIVYRNYQMEMDLVSFQILDAKKLAVNNLKKEGIIHRTFSYTSKAKCRRILELKQDSALEYIYEADEQYHQLMFLHYKQEQLVYIQRITQLLFFVPNLDTLDIQDLVLLKSQ